MNVGVTAHARTRRLPIGATYNLRDVGDYPLASGGCTRWGLLFRSDAARFADAGRAELESLGLRTVIDLRDDAERAMLPTGMDALVPRVLSRPLDPRPLLSHVRADGADPLGELYTAIVRERGDRIAAIVNDLAQEGALPALVHCAAGKDRTGVVIALVLSAIGVPDDVVRADFALTSEYLTADFFAGLPAESGAADSAADEPLRAAHPESIGAMLRAVEESHGSARDFLVAHGVATDRIDHLRTALTA